MRTFVLNIGNVSIHELHDKINHKNCLPELKNRYNFLSDNPSSALSRAKKEYPDWKIDGCGHCMSRHHQNK